jgi:lipopolysaccharide export system protein LptA
MTPARWLMPLALLGAPAMAATPAPVEKSQVITGVGAKPAPAAGSGLGLTGGTGPVQIESENGLEWHQNEQVYVAHGNVVVTRGDRKLQADTVFAYYRPVRKPGQPVPVKSTPAKSGDPTDPDSSTEIWRIVADGKVTLSTPTQTLVGDHGVDDLDQQTMVMTGKGLKLTTPEDVVTARDSLEWYDGKHLAIARGDALIVRADKGRRLRGDTLAALVVEPPGQPQRISRVDAAGHVVVTGPTQTGTGDKGVYDADHGKVTLIGHVKLIRGDNILMGQYGVMDMNSGVSELRPAPGSGAEKPPQVQGILVPHPSNRGTPAAAAGPSPAATAPENPQGDGANPR